MKIPQSGAQAVVTAYLSAISSRDFDALPSYFTPNATWWISGNSARVPKAGERPASEQLPNLPNLLTRFDEYSYNVENILSGPGGRVMVEAQAIGKGPEDLLYVNNITSSYVVTREGKINHVREYPEHKEIDWLLEWFKEHPDA